MLNGYSHCVMEATGSYYQGLATWLYSRSGNVSVVNPLSVKRFILMRLKTSKTDKLDAQMIRMYGESEEPKRWRPPSKLIIEATELHKLIEILVRQRAALKNRSHALIAKGITRSPVVTSVRRQIRNLLFMCAFTACEHNKSCREIYQRITAKVNQKSLL